MKNSSQLTDGFALELDKTLYDQFPVMEPLTFKQVTLKYLHPSGFELSTFNLFLRL
jgi:hypothetical protein